MVAVAAAGIAAAGSVAAAGVQAGTAGGKHGGGAPKYQGMTPWERIFNRGTADMQDEERKVMEDSLAQANWMQPEMYKLLGYEPVYDDRVSPDQLKALGDAADQLQLKQQENQTSTQQSQLDLKLYKRQLRGLKGAANKPARQALKKQIADLHVTINQNKQDFGPLQKEAAAAQKALGDAQSMPRRVIGLKPLANGPTDPTGSAGGLYKIAGDLQNQALVNALQGKEPIDTTLKTQWDQREMDLREQLRRQLGDDYETSTAGSLALAQFDRQRNDAFSSYNTNIVAQLSQETQQRAESLSNLTSARMQQLMYPSNVESAKALELGQAAGGRLGTGELFQHERLAQFEGASKAHDTNVAEQQAQGQAISGLINSVSSGIGAAGSSLGKYLGSTNNSAFNNSATDPRNVAGM